MSCSGGLTGLVMVAAGGMITNGAVSGTFGAAPFSSLAGAPLSLSDSLTGLTNFAPTLNTMTTGLASISGAGAPLAGLGSALTAMNGAGFTSDMVSAFNSIPTDLGTGGGLFDAVAGFAPSVNSLLTDVTGSGVLNDALKYAGDWSAETLGGSFAGIGGAVTGDPKKFGTILNTASSYVTNANQMINAATNSTALGTTFTNLNNIVSGSLAGVNLDFGGFGDEIAKLGNTINLSNLDNLGSPGQLLSNLGDQGTLGPMYSKLAEISVDPRVAQTLASDLTNIASTGNVTLGELGIDFNAIAQQGANLSPAIQSQLFEAFDSLDATEVDQVKSILGNSQDFVVNGSDLLDPKKLFPSSFETFTAPLRTASVGFRAIYENDTGSVNGQFESLGENLKGVIPDDLAVASGALARSLQQVKNISQTNTTDLGTALSSLETLKDLSLLENQSTYVTDAVRDYWTDSYGVDSTNNVTLATGNAGQLKLSDVIGFAAGFNSAAPITKNAQLLAEMDADGELDDITASQGIYDTIEEFCAGTFGPNGVGAEPYSSYEVVITAGYVGEGTYTGVTSTEAFENAWVNGIVPAIKTILAGFTSNTKAVEIMTNSERWNQQLAREYLNQSRIDNEDLTAVRASDDVAINLALNLPNLGTDTTDGGAAEILERVVDFSSLGGQATIAAMREGRNLQRLADANIQQDAPIDTAGVEDPASLVTSTYTAAEAKNQLIKS
jgi:hypothetical protein